MNDIECPICHEARLSSRTHKCPPIWHVMLVGFEDSDNLKKVYAKTAEEAASKHCEIHDVYGGDYTIVRDGEAQVIVYDANGENPILFDIEAYSEPVYNARKAKEQPDWPQLEKDGELP